MNTHVLRSRGSLPPLRETEPPLLEAIAVSARLKPLTYTSYEPDQFPYILSLCRRLGLKRFAPSTSSIACSGGRAKTIFLASGGSALSLAARYWTDGTSSQAWGRLLGYPDCCVDSFAARPADRTGKELILRAAREIGHRPVAFAMNNIFNFSSRIDVRDPADVSLHEALAAKFKPLNLSALHVIAWHPCSYRCRASLRKAKRLFALLRLRLPTFAEKIQFHLRRPVIFFDKYRFVPVEGRRAGDSLIIRRIAGPASSFDSRQRALLAKPRVPISAVGRLGGCVLDFSADL